ncbi:alpha/beta fold hydrolase [Roseivivax sediminis]|uniref:Pimeloyl-ACP methyl ester carboxylesterase n=1 Tax=Roseivivax sediminis TaxID=936889 RepID=A0A1I1ST51_9RHOB|nr:alpha/beta fold hydrolase [Roseivivax sediminis]SFD49522.1 Pimeloyl-ACP methyl ester carboxylesterase [Roseivivax sediminis]
MSERDILLVHGSCHGAWCWRDVMPALEARGHAVRAIDLPSHGADRTPVAEVTLDLYGQAILAALDRPAMVVGHSMAGYPISRAAEIDPSRIARLVYLCAYVPWPGLGLVEMRRRAPRQPILKALEKSADGLSFSILPEHAREVFYHDCPDESVEYALARVCPQPVRPQETPVTLGPRYASVPRSYVVCEEDGAIPTEFQRTMAADFAPADVHALPGSHSPFFARPAALADLLHDIAEP